MIRLLIVLLLLIVVTVIVIAMVKQAGQQPYLPLVNAATCEPIDYRTPGFRHPWEPIVDRDKDPRSYA